MKQIDLSQAITIIANLGVIAGIVFLAVEVNQNSVINRVSSVQEIRQSMQGINLLSMENPSFAALNVKLLNNEELDSIEAQQSFDFFLYMMGQSRLAFYQYTNGLISEADLLSMLAPFGFWVRSSDITRGFWEERRFAQHDEFYDYVSANLTAI